MDNKILLQNFFDDRLAIHEKYTLKRKELDAIMDEEFDSIITSFIEELKKLLPAKLLEKVENAFSFTNEKVEGKVSLWDYLKEHAKHFPGIVPFDLESLSMSTEDIEKVNSHWKSVITISIEYSTIFLRESKEQEQVEKKFSNVSNAV